MSLCTGSWDSTVSHCWKRFFAPGRSLTYILNSSSRFGRGKIFFIVKNCVVPSSATSGKPNMTIELYRITSYQPTWRPYIPVRAPEHHMQYCQPPRIHDSWHSMTALTIRFFCIESKSCRTWLIVVRTLPSTCLRSLLHTNPTHVFRASISTLLEQFFSHATSTIPIFTLYSPFFQHPQYAKISVPPVFLANSAGPGR